MSIVFKNRYLISRRVVQLTVLALFLGANIWGWTFLKGNLSAANVMDSFYLADPFAAIQMLFAGMLISTDIIIGGIIILVFYALIAGRSFCSWVCPLNMVADLASWVRKQLPFNLTQRLNVNRNARYWILGLSLIVSMFMGVAAFEYISPIGILHRGIIYGFGTGILIVVAIFIFDLLVLKHGWCGHLCPLGAFYSLTTKKSLLRIFHTKENCTDCMDCKVVCPEQQVLDIIGKKSGTISYGACTNCARCIEVCPDNALKFQFKIKTK